MKRRFVFLATMLLTSAAVSAQSFTTYELANSTLHAYSTGDVMGDMSFIVEGKKSLVVLEQPLFKSNIAEFAEYVEALEKPVERVIASYHQGGLSPYSAKQIVMPNSMIAFSQSPASKGMIANFSKNFGEAADLAPFGKVKGVDLPTTERWAGVEFELTAGAKSDFPAASILIDNSAYYTHFAPSQSHASPMVIRSAEAIDANLAELRKIEASGVEYIFGSHGAPATMADVKFQIEYLTTLKQIYLTSSDADTFGQRLIIAYQSLPGYEQVRAVASKLYPDEVKDAEREAVRERMHDYLAMVSNLDVDIAKGLWADNEAISIITPRSHFIGFDSIMNDFLIRTFSSMKSRELSSVSEVIDVYGDSAQVKLYWRFKTVDANGVERVGRGRESLIFAKLDGEWRLVHVHYSPLPQN